MSNNGHQDDGWEQTVPAEEAGINPGVEKLILTDGLPAGVHSTV